MRAGARALDWRRVECVRREKERERGCGGRPAAEWRRTSWCGRAGLSAGEQGEQGCLEKRSRAATSAGGNGAGRESRLGLVAQLAGPPSTTTRCRSTRPSCTSAPHQNTDTHSHNCRTPCAAPPAPTRPCRPHLARPVPRPHQGTRAMKPFPSSAERPPLFLLPFTSTSTAPRPILSRPLFSLERPRASTRAAWTCRAVCRAVTRASVSSRALLARPASPVAGPRADSPRLALAAATSASTMARTRTARLATARLPTATTSRR